MVDQSLPSPTAADARAIDADQRRTEGITTPADPWAWRRLCVRLLIVLAVCGGLFLWWRWGLPIGMAEAIWLCFS